MEVLSLCPYPAAPLLWQIQPGRWVLTVVCKATFGLSPGVLSAVRDQDPILDEDLHPDDDRQRSPVAPADLVPFKTRADVVLVGSAYARAGQSVRSATVRLAVGKIDKSIEVLCPRVRTQSGEVREGKRWTKAPLTWERATGGPGTDNPVGVGVGGKRDPYGQLPLPALQTPGFVLEEGKLPKTMGFGPLGADWPLRRSRVGRGGDDHDVTRAPFGDGFDPAYFQVAPADQQVDALRADERITLENLHPGHALLVTALPGVLPRARVELAGAPAREIVLAADTLCIDTDRLLVTVTYRGKVDVESAEPQGRVLVALPKGDRSIKWAQLAPPPAPSPQAIVPRAPGAQPPPAGAPVVLPAPPGPPPRGQRGSQPGPIAAAPPARGSQSGVVSSQPGVVVGPQGAPPSPPPPPPPPLQRASQLPPAPPVPPGRVIGVAAVEVELAVSPEDLEEAPDSDVELEITMSEMGQHRAAEVTGPVRAITRQISAAPADAAALPFVPAPEGWESPAARPSRSAAPPQAEWAATPVLGVPAVQLEGWSARGAEGPRHTLPDWYEAGLAPPPGQSAATSELPPAVVPPPLMTSPAWAPVAPQTPPPLLGAVPVDGAFGLLEASNAAARVVPGAAGAAEVQGARGEEGVSGKGEGRARAPAAAAESVAVELVWFDPAAGAFLPEGASSDKLSGGGESPAPGAGAPSPEAVLKGRVHEVLSRGAALGIGALESVLEAAEERTPPPPAVVLVQGTLELALDETEMLKAIVAAASPLASSDKKLKEAIDVANEVLKAPTQGMPELLQGLGSRIREAWGRANRHLPADHLASCTERLLLEQRAYQKRELLDDTWIRALLANGNDAPPVPAYLPARIAKRLPLFRRFAARVLGEVVYQQDQYETCPVALRVMAIGRLPPRPRRPRRS